MYKIIFTICVFVLCSCSGLLCGDLNGEWLKLLTNANNKYSSKFSIENIPCEFYYINVTIKCNNNDTVLLKDLHSELYDSTRKIGWPVFVVFDKEKNYLFHDAVNGNKKHSSSKSK